MVPFYILVLKHGSQLPGAPQGSRVCRMALLTRVLAISIL